jgi:hypothetical protein
MSSSESENECPDGQRVCQMCECVDDDTLRQIEHDDGSRGHGPETDICLTCIRELLNHSIYDCPMCRKPIRNWVINTVRIQPYVERLIDDPDSYGYRPLHRASGPYVRNILPEDDVSSSDDSSEDDRDLSPRRDRHRRHVRHVSPQIDRRRINIESLRDRLSINIEEQNDAIFAIENARNDVVREHAQYTLGYLIREENQILSELNNI